MGIRARGMGLLVWIALMSSGCMSAYVKSVGGDTDRVFDRIYKTDFNTAWQGVLDALRSYPLSTSNRESGVVETKWVDNTAAKNFVDSLGAGSLYQKAQFRFQVSVAKGFFDGKPTVKVSIRKEQWVQSDVLEGWRSIPTDSLDENTLLYRVGRIISIRIKIAKQEEESTKQAIENTKF